MNPTPYSLDIIPIDKVVWSEAITQMYLEVHLLTEYMNQILRFNQNGAIEDVTVDANNANIRKTRDRVF
jgi:hypothetical protein